MNEVCLSLSCVRRLVDHVLFDFVNEQILLQL